MIGGQMTSTVFILMNIYLFSALIVALLARRMFTSDLVINPTKEAELREQLRKNLGVHRVSQQELVELMGKVFLFLSLIPILNTIIAVETLLLAIWRSIFPQQ